MTRKRHKPEEIVTKLRQVEVLTAQGRPVAEAIRSIGVTEVAAGRAARRRGLLHASGGQGRDRGLAQARQPSMDASRCKLDVGVVGCGCHNLSGLLRGRSRPWP